MCPELYRLMLVFAMQMLQTVFMMFWMSNVHCITCKTRLLCKTRFLEKIN